MNNTYLYINFFVFLFPFLLSFDRKVNFFRLNYFPLLVTTLFSGSIFIVWDIVYTKLGVWGFNPNYTSAFSLYNLPLGEVLFFITVPYACIFLYEVLLAYEIKLKLDPTIIKVIAKKIAFVLAILGIIFFQKLYTVSVCLTSATMLYVICRYDNILRLKNFTLLYVIQLFGFLLVNGILTFLPVVVYSEKHIIGSRFISIPIEDFLYCLSMHALYLFVYELVKKRRPKILNLNSLIVMIAISSLSSQVVLAENCDNQCKLKKVRSSYFSAIINSKKIDSSYKFVDKKYLELKQEKIKASKENSFLISRVSAFRASLICLQARESYFPMKKWRLANECLDILDNELSNYPESIEHLTLRYVITSHLPFFFNRSKQSKQDYKKLKTQMLSDKFEQLPKEVQDFIKNSLK